MAADPYTDETSTQRFQRSASASERLREANFPMVVRGYHRQTVDVFLAELLELVADLESHQTREGVVQKALGELGEETAGILQRAHETADDITARSRAQADARLQRAEREAEILRRDADEYAEQVIVDTRALWDERQRLIEDIRQLADEVLGTADDALDRLKLPEQIGNAEETEALPPEGDPETMALAPEAEAEPEQFAEDPEPTEPFRLGAVAEEPEDAPPPEEHGHTVELEALPGGSEEPPRREPD
jgi:cell division septum initiation protein DivIVA